MHYKDYNYDHSERKLYISGYNFYIAIDMNIQSYKEECHLVYNCNEWRSFFIFQPNLLINILKKKKKRRGLEHPVFPGGHPSKY